MLFYHYCTTNKEKIPCNSIGKPNAADPPKWRITGKATFPNNKIINIPYILNWQKRWNMYKFTTNPQSIQIYSAESYILNTYSATYTKLYACSTQNPKSNFIPCQKVRVILCCSCCQSSFLRWLRSFRPGLFFVESFC